MWIEWKITKQRGNLRPVLRYTVRLEDHEKALALPPVSIVSTIPKPEEERQEHCYPGLFERAEPPAFSGVYSLEAPSHKGQSWMYSLRLPWREDNAYPEVEASFLLLREALEKELEAACRSVPLELSGSMRTSGRAKAAMAPGIAAERFLKLAESGARTG